MSLIAWSIVLWLYAQNHWWCLGHVKNECYEPKTNELPAYIDTDPPGTARTVRCAAGKDGTVYCYDSKGASK